MPYNYPEKVPNYLKNLPDGAQKIFIAAFNAEYESSKNEEKARQAGWGAVKNKYKKVGDKWIMKNQQLYIMQVPFDGGIIQDETKLRQLFGDKYDEAVSFEQQLKKDDPKYFGDGKPFVVGGYFLKYQEMKEEYCKKWMQSGNMWLQRTVLLFQLKYKEKTDTALLSRAILELSSSKEFFIRKAIGWSLRQYSKTNPDFVSDLVEKNKEKLSPLSRKEALKVINKKRMD